jgi:hypothetical protein
VDAERAPVSIVIDVANVMGARADGWWRDRAGAALRLCREISVLADRGITAAEFPSDTAAGITATSITATDITAAGITATDEPSGVVRAAFVLVLEGRAREAADRFDGPHPLVRIVLASGSGDDAIVAEVEYIAAKREPCLVVTADRELRRRCSQAGGRTTGPGWLLQLL